MQTTMKKGEKPSMGKMSFGKLLLYSLSALAVLLVAFGMWQTYISHHPDKPRAYDPAYDVSLHRGDAPQPIRSVDEKERDEREAAKQSEDNAARDRYYVKQYQEQEKEQERLRKEHDLEEHPWRR